MRGLLNAACIVAVALISVSCSSSPHAADPASKTATSPLNVSAAQAGLDAVIQAHPVMNGFVFLTKCPYDDEPSLLTALGQASRFPGPYFYKSRKKMSTDNPLTELSLTVEQHSGVAASPDVDCRADGGKTAVAELDVQTFQALSHAQWASQIISTIHGPFPVRGGQLFTTCSAAADLGTTDCDTAWFPPTERLALTVSCQWAGATETTCGDALKAALPVVVHGLATQS